ncbi:IS1 family transposase [Beggiatoa leptomitoformis]|uniref:IS1 family transposase n=1 Tax=Beggiatoa leptomitoformis TaxID=288004 RepID=UPI0039C857A1
MPDCPECQSHHVIKNGKTHFGKQNYKCRGCGRQFVENANPKRISQETWEQVERLLKEKRSLAGISRVTGISGTWLQRYVNRLYEKQKLEPMVKKKGALQLECDEMWSFVGKRREKVWIWLALDKETREVVGFAVGKRDKRGASALWESLPSVYRQCAVCYTDFWEAYKGVLPSKCHRAVGKETGLTNHIERFNNTLRQRVSRLVRKTLSFSKKLQNHVGAIIFFINHYNLSLLV